MKKLTLFACAFLLTSIAFTSCKDKENEPTKQNEVVKTEFSIALPNQVAAGPNRMPSTTVQKGGRAEFQGMTGITLVPFINQSAIASTDTRLGDNITLGDIAAASELGTNSNAKVYTDVSIPLSTASFLFYAESKKTGSNFEKGVLTAVNLDNTHQPADFQFNLSTLIANLSAAYSDTKAAGLLAYLNGIAQATDGTHQWREYDVAYPATYDPAMAAMFVEFARLHFLSSTGIERMVNDLYNSLAPFSTTLATNIKAAIANATYASVTGSGPYTVTLASDYQGYPANLNLPDGSVHIVWDDSNASALQHVFRACSEAEYTAENHANPSQFVYPSSLWYFANSQIKTSNTSKQAMYDNVNDWATVLAAHTNAVAVNTNTRAVAIVNPIQYAVARFDAQVKVAATTLKDQTDADVTNTTGYPVTAVLVGGQKNVGFDFKPVGANVYTIYDNVMTSSSMVASTSYSDMNSTLVLETPTGNVPANDIRIAVEFTNNSGVDFFGVDGCLIPAGGKFYAVATLEVSEADETGYAVFKQDYTTTAQLNLKSLKNVYNTIPDLRTPKLELGFSVNLTWEAGNTYTINIE